MLSYNFFEGAFYKNFVKRNLYVAQFFDEERNTMKKLDKVLIVTGIFMCVAWAIGLCMFVFGLFAFVMVGEQEYFSEYVALQGDYAIVNVMFVLDYILIGIGSLGLPTLAVGFLRKILNEDNT